MTPLSPSQNAVLHFIRAYIKEIGYPPSIAEIAQGVKLRSQSSAHYQLRVLEERGYLRRDPNRPRALVLLTPPGSA